MIDERLKQLFENGTKSDSVMLFDASHPLKIYVGYNDRGQKSLSVVMDSEIEKTDSSKMISVNYFKRDDGTIELNFCLLDDDFSGVFNSFCKDIIESTYNLTEGDGFSPVIRRWELWQELLKKTNDILSRSEIMGLIGELVLFSRFLIPKYGADKTLEAYIGPNMSHKDYDFGDIWFESKAISNGARSVTISSIEQLESDRNGTLSVVILDDSVFPDSDNSITLNSIVEDTLSYLDESQKRKLKDKLLKAGYVHNEKYDEIVFLVINAQNYNVEGDFPRIIKSILPNGISKAKYEIDLSAINNYKAEKWI